MVAVQNPFSPGSIVFLLSPYGLAPELIVAEMLIDAGLAEAAGFDGVLISEHHAGFPGYIPNPLQITGLALAATKRIWAAPCPMLLPLRPTGIVAEEAAWLAAAFPGRVGLGVGLGAAPADFEVADVPYDERSQRYRAALALLVQALQGQAEGALSRDAAVERCREHPIPVVSAATTKAGVRLAARCGAGILLDGLSPLSWSAELAATYRAAEGTGPVVLSRRAWIGHAPEAQANDDIDRYRSFTPAQIHDRITTDDSMINAEDPAAVARQLAAARSATTADCLSLRLNLPGMGIADVREQIDRFGAEVLPLVAAAK